MAQDQNITFAGHTINHVSLTSYQTESAFKEISEGKKQLEAMLGREVDFFAYPYGSFDSRIISLVEKAGYKLAFTTIYGINQSSATFFNEPRVRISGNDSLAAFIGKVNSRRLK
jgi:peptidoglycan/xylan/chitin deacetylase (PgdA/CDA1 family)